MKTLLTLHAMFHLALAPLFASEAMPLEPYPPNMKSPWLHVTDVNKASISELHAMAEEAPYPQQFKAVEKLLKSGDAPTLARVVYAFRQGNDEAEGALFDTASVSVVPYLLEDVAHGSLEIYYGESMRLNGRVRHAATEMMLMAFVQTPGLPAETRSWFGYLENEASYFQYLPELSKALLEWWDHNGDALLAGRPDQATWLPAERKLSPQVFEEWKQKNAAKTPPIRQHEPPPASLMPALPLHVAESFEAWAKRVTDPKRRDATWKSIDFERGVSVDASQINTAGSNTHDVLLPKGSDDHVFSSTPPSEKSNGLAGVSTHDWTLLAIAGGAISGIFLLLFSRQNRR